MPSACESEEYPDSEVFGNAIDVEIRPGRTLKLLHIPPPPDGNQYILFVHGSMATMQQYECQIEHFVASKKYGIVAYDWLGCGESAAPEGWDIYSCDEHLYDARAVFDRYCAGVSTTLIGHSMGSSLCVRLADELSMAGSPKTPLGITGLVLIAGSVAFKTSAAAVFLLPVWLLELIRPVLTGGKFFTSVSGALSGSTRTRTQQQSQIPTSYCAVCRVSRPGSPPLNRCSEDRSAQAADFPA